MTIRKQWLACGGSWITDKQDAFLSGIAAEFPDVPHRYCQNHFLRDVAKPALEEDSHAKVQMRSKARGLRAIERQVLQDQRTAAVAVSAETSLPVSEGKSRAELGPPPDSAAADLLLYRYASPPECQFQAIARRKLICRARSSKQRPPLLAELGARYKDTS